MSDELQREETAKQQGNLESSVLRSALEESNVETRIYKDETWQSSLSEKNDILLYIDYSPEKILSVLLSLNELSYQQK